MNEETVLDESEVARATRNQDLLRDVALALFLQPEIYEWDQDTWGEGEVKRRNGHSCGSAHCTAGFVVAFEGYLPCVSPDGTSDWVWVTKATPGLAIEYGKQIARALDADWSRYAELFDTAEQRLVSSAAQELLGLTGDESNSLFSGTWTPDAVVWRSTREDQLPDGRGVLREAEGGSQKAQAIALMAIADGAPIRHTGNNLYDPDRAPREWLYEPRDTSWLPLDRKV